MNRTLDSIGSEGQPPPTCADVRDQLPLLGLYGLSAPERVAAQAHLKDCGACREQAVFVSRLQAARPEPPADLSGRIQAAVAREDHRNVEVGPAWWRWSAAALVVLALGVGALWNGDDASTALGALAFEPVTTAGYGEDWVVAEMPLLEALPDELLRILLEEMEQ